MKRNVSALLMLLQSVKDWVIYDQHKSLRGLEAGKYKIKCQYLAIIFLTISSPSRRMKDRKEKNIALTQVS